MTLALATCLTLPEPDDDEALLLDALRAARVDARMAAWDDPTVDWSAFSAVVLRSTWNYHHRLDDFLAWVDRVGARGPVHNHPALVRWNAHKGYLLALGTAGVPIVPTQLVPRGGRFDAAATLARWPRVVAKPAVSAGSFATIRAWSGDERRLAEHVAHVSETRDVLLQPYLESVEHHGERCLIFMGDTLTHSVRKAPRFDGDAEGTTLVTPSRSEIVAAERVLAAVPGRCLYARVDLAPDDRGQPLLMEVELIEPSLFLRYDAAALERFVSLLGSRPAIRT